VGVALQRLGRPAAALAELERAVALDSKNPLARFERAAALASLGQEREALDALRELAAAFPAEAGVRFQMGRLHKRLGDLDAALACYGDALDLGPCAADAGLIKAAIDRLEDDEEDGEDEGL
jgi:anaphase-promoting complex subunit 3